MWMPTLRRPTRVNAHPEQDLEVWDVPDLEAEDVDEQVEGQGGDVAGVKLAVAGGQSAGHHVVVGDGLHLVHVVRLDDFVEARVQVVQQVHHLQGHEKTGLFVSLLNV